MDGGECERNKWEVKKRKTNTKVFFKGEYAGAKHRHHFNWHKKKGIDKGLG